MRIYEPVNTTPSAEDISFTKRLAAAATLVACPLLDHVLVTREAEEWVSMLDAGLLPGA